MFRRKYTGFKRKASSFGSRRYVKRSKPNKKTFRRRRGKYNPGNTSVESSRWQPTTTVRFRGQGKSHRIGWTPTIKGTTHRAESHHVANSSLSGGGANSLLMCINNLGAANLNQEGTYSVNTFYDDFDAYTSDAGAQNMPLGMRKIYLKGVKQQIHITNNKEQACSFRICYFKLKRNLQNNFTELCRDVDRPFSTRHFKLIKMFKGIMEPQTYVGSETPSGITKLKKSFYFPFNKWRYTSTGDPAANGDEWNVSTHDLREALWVVIDTDDTTAADSKYLTFDIRTTHYFSTAESNET